MEKQKNMKYLVSHLSFFENEIKNEVIEGEDKFEALKKSKVVSKEWVKETDFPKSFEGLEDYLFNADIVVNVVLIDELIK